MKLPVSYPLSGRLTFQDRDGVTDADIVRMYFHGGGAYEVVPFYWRASGNTLIVPAEAVLRIEFD